jgi:hypothetical protein
MPDLITNTQGQNSTVSDNGRNVRPVLQAVSHFVLQTDNGVCYISQTNSFGVVSSSEFQTTSKLTFTGAKKVYILCKGQVLLQPTSDSNKVNLILKPFEQPIKGLPIKYIIYRGLTKSDFINSSDILTGSATTGTEFVQFLWKEFNQFYSSENQAPGSTTPVFSSSFIGFPTGTSQPDSQLIDTLFYKLSETEVVDAGAGTLSEPAEKAFELPMIPRGTVIGTVTGELGIDIVLNQGDYYIENDAHPFQFNLGYARSLDYKLVTTNEPDEFKKKLIRETCTQFMDVSAFYGLHANGSGKVYVNGTTTPLTTIDAVYGLMGGFYTKNTQYFYIQSSRQRSYNFYGNYTYSDTNANNLKIGIDSNNLTEVVFGDASWPLHKFNSNPTTSDTIFLKLLAKYSFEGVFLYSKVGDIENMERKDFVLQREIFDESITGNQIHYTNEIAFKINLLEQSSVAVSSIFQLIYYGTELGTPYLFDEVNLHKKKNKITLLEMFCSPMIRSVYSDDSLTLKIVNSNRISMLKVDYDGDAFSEQMERIVLQKVVFEKGYKEDLLTNTTLVKDRLLFISQLAKNEDEFYNISAAKNILKDSDDVKKKAAYGNSNVQYLYNNLSNQKSSLLPSKSEDYFLNRYHLGLTLEEINQLLQSLPNQAYNISFCFNEDISLESVDNSIMVSFLKFSVGLMFENSLGQIQTIYPSSPIYVYGTRLSFLSSPLFIEFENTATLEDINNLL